MAVRGEAVCVGREPVFPCMPAPLCVGHPHAAHTFASCKVTLPTGPVPSLPCVRAPPFFTLRWSIATRTGRIMPCVINFASCKLAEPLQDAIVWRVLEIGIDNDMCQGCDASDQHTHTSLGDEGGR